MILKPSSGLRRGGRGEVDMEATRDLQGDAGSRVEYGLWA
jgi:hypothetical protein